MGSSPTVDWAPSTLEELTNESPITYGVVKPGAEGSIPFVRGGDISNGQINVGQLRTITKEVSEQYRRTLLRGGELVVSLVGNPGQVAQVPKKLAGANIARQVALVRIGEEADPDFVRYALTSSHCQLQLTGYTMGSVQQVINLRDLKRVEVPLPPLPEQKAIAHILGTLDDKIALNRRMNATLEGMAQALFKSWFVDFDPVIDNAIKAGNPIPDELADRAEVRRQALADGTANREAAKPFPAAFQETESMGWIPEGWEVQEFGKLAKNIREGVDPRTLPHETPYVGLEHIDKHSFSLSRWGFANDVDSQKSHFNPEDFLFGKLRPYFHKVCRVNSDGICSTDILVIRPRLEEDAGYVGCQIFESEFVEYANLRSTGTRMPRASWKDMSKYEVAGPPQNLRKAFNDMIKPIREKCAGAVIANQNLGKLRDTLLPKLISGEIRLSDAEQLKNCYIKVNYHG